MSFVRGIWRYSKQNTQQVKAKSKSFCRFMCSQSCTILCKIMQNQSTTIILYMSMQRSHTQHGTAQTQTCDDLSSVVILLLLVSTQTWTSLIELDNPNNTRVRTLKFPICRVTGSHSIIKGRELCSETRDRSRSLGFIIIHFDVWLYTHVRKDWFKFWAAKNHNC